MSKHYFTRATATYGGGKVGTNMHVEASLLRGVTYKVAKHLPPNSRVTVEPDRKTYERRHPVKTKTMKHTDEQVFDCIRRNLLHGETCTSIGRSIGVHEAVVRHWVLGENRRHLRQQVDRELYARRKT